MRTAIVLVVAAICCSPALAQSRAGNAPNVEGRWVGTSEGAAVDRFVTTRSTFVVTEQQGRAFKAYAIYIEDGGPTRRSEHAGTIAMDNRTIYSVDDSGMLHATLTGPRTMDFCYFASGSIQKTTCGSYVREAQ